MSTTTSPPSLTPHQKETLLFLGRRVRGTEFILGSEIGSFGALDHLVRKGYANRRTEYGPRGGTIRWYALSELGRHVVDRYGQVPPEITFYFDEPEARPVVAQVFITGWAHSGWDRKVITRSLVHEMRRAGVVTVAVSYAGRTADFQIKELVK